MPCSRPLGLRLPLYTVSPAGAQMCLVAVSLTWCSCESFCAGDWHLPSVAVHALGQAPP